MLRDNGLDTETTGEIESAESKSNCSDERVATDGLEQIYAARLAFRELVQRNASSLEELANYGLLLDPDVASGFKAGFTFSLDAITFHWWASASREDRAFFTDESGVIRFPMLPCPVADDTPIGG